MEKDAIEKFGIALLAIIFLENFLISVAQDGDYNYRDENSAYMIIHDMKNWQDAFVDCKKRGMGLVAFETQSKLVQLHMFLFKKDYLTSKVIHPEEKYIYWTSGSNRQKENKYIWESTRKNIDFFHWRRFPTEVVGNCIAIGASAFSRMTNSSCEEEHYYICERQNKKS